MSTTDTDQNIAESAARHEWLWDGFIWVLFPFLGVIAISIIASGPKSLPTPNDLLGEGQLFLGIVGVCVGGMARLWGKTFENEDRSRAKRLHGFGLFGAAMSVLLYGVTTDRVLSSTGYSTTSVTVLSIAIFAGCSINAVASVAHAAKAAG